LLRQDNADGNAMGCCFVPFFTYKVALAAQNGCHVGAERFNPLRAKINLKCSLYQASAAT
jgi:hypothetical protein